MAKRKQTDTSVRATINGIVKEFSSIEQASKETGISVNAIKIRCNKHIIKDNIQFEWKNQDTKLSYRGKSNKQKGTRLEYEIVENLKKIGYTDVARSAYQSKKLDDNGVDIASDTLEIAIQAKSYTNFPNYFNIKAKCKDKRDFVMIWKKTNHGTLAVMDVNLFYKLLKIYHQNKK